MLFFTSLFGGLLWLHLDLLQHVQEQVVFIHVWVVVLPPHSPIVRRRVRQDRASRIEASRNDRLVARLQIFKPAFRVFIPKVDAPVLPQRAKRVELWVELYVVNCVDFTPGGVSVAFECEVVLLFFCVNVVHPNAAFYGTYEVATLVGEGCDATCLKLERADLGGVLLLWIV